MTSPQNSDFLTPTLPLSPYVTFGAITLPGDITKPDNPPPLCYQYVSQITRLKITNYTFFEDFFILFIFIKQFDKKFLKLAFKKTGFCTNF